VIVSINSQNPQMRLIGQVVEALRHGAVVCYPTDTVYGIGCDIFSQKAIKRIYQLKQRPLSGRPFSFMCPSLKDVSTYAHISNAGYRIMKKGLPGPFTFVLPAAKLVPKIMTTRQKTVGIRVPDHAVCRALLSTLGNPMLTTSAALDPEAPPLMEAYEVAERFGRQVDLIIDSGPLVYSAPSTIISLVGDQPEILRQGKGDASLLL
jgi:tRNA threonylcarbamoyl adenosine modification protein (Sua5/YciO/YrdC/YwlC family)